MKITDLILNLTVSLILSYVFYKLYQFAPNWNFMIAFLGGAVTIGTVLIMNKK